MQELCMIFISIFMGMLKGFIAFAIVGLLIWFGSWLLDKMKG